MAANMDVDIPESGAVFTFGRSRFADNVPSHFYIRNDPVVEITCGDEHTAVICQKGRVFVFGNNDFGQLGLGHKNVTVKPSCVKSLKPEKAVHIACGRAHTLVSTESGKLFAWGNNSDGQLGVGDIADRAAPTRVVGIHSDIAQLSAGCLSSAALTVNGQVYVWGSNSDGQLGLPETSECLSPVLLPFDQRIVHISCGYYHTAFVTESGALYTCGESESGKLGLPDSLTNITTPQKVTLAVPVKSVYCGGNHTIALTVDGEVYAFGNNFNGQLGLGAEVTQFILPTKVISLEDLMVTTVSCGESHTAFVTDRGGLYTCGESRHGKLCNEQDNNNQSVPVPMKASKFKGYMVAKVACGGCHTMVLACERKDFEEDELDAISQSINSDGDPVNNRNSLPPLQRVPFQSPNNNPETTGSFHDSQSNHLEELLDSRDEIMVENDFEMKSSLSGSKKSSSDSDDIDADIDEALSLQSAKPELRKQQSKKEIISSARSKVLQTSEVEDEIKDIGDKSDENKSESSSDDDDEDNSDVKIESEKKEGRVARFFSALRRKKPTSAQSAVLDGRQSVEKRKRASSEVGVVKDQDMTDAEQDRGDSGKSKHSIVGNEKKSSTCSML
ncbi:X-linked retinitis pigmentosa GTPase regulator-like [Periplaneta americana]|uniref:X-linked retinitis pigmentosa GTPase regulator-like n=1 Tax=Periplaneta americana TaxID=6978 RepID=UPI0037E7D0E3